MSHTHKLFVDDNMIQVLCKAFRKMVDFSSRLSRFRLCLKGNLMLLASVLSADTDSVRKFIFALEKVS